MAGVKVGYISSIVSPAAALLLLVLHGPGCSQSSEFTARIAVIDELGAPISGVSIDLGSQVFVTDKSGEVDLDTIDGPIAGVASGSGLLSEPLIVGSLDNGQTITLRMLSDRGGQRWVMHSAGDVMFGRRYREPRSDDPDDPDYDPLIPGSDIAGGTEQVVEPIRRMFAAADLGTVNLEGPITEISDNNAYPAKRSSFKNHPDSIAGLLALGVDVAALANDHIRDYNEAGISETKAALSSAGIAHVGAYTNDPSLGGNPPATIDTPGAKVGFLAWSLVTGSGVNDRYPENIDPEPDDLDERLRWQFDLRDWGFRSTNRTIPDGLRRIGEAWKVFKELEAELLDDPIERAAAWESITAVYPELQDWVARRGHGGAALWQEETSVAEIETLRSDVDVLVVQLHTGYSFREAPSSLGRAAARAAIDAGADIVLAHHTHVLQGAEWYKGKLIVYSLGNLAYDLDVLQSLPGAFLRTVWDGTELVEARFVLYEQDDYQPVPVSDRAAEQTALSLWAMSRLEAESTRDSEGEIITQLVERDGATRPALIQVRNHDAVLLDGEPVIEPFEVDLPVGEVVALSYQGLTNPAYGVPGLRAGRDLLGWGHFEDHLADGEAKQGTHWDIGGSGHEEILVGRGAGEGTAYLRLTRQDTSENTVTTKLSALVAVPRHRLYREFDGMAVPADGDPAYSVRFLARLYGDARMSVKINSYHDLDSPFVPSVAARIAQRVLPFEVPDDGSWHVIELTVPGEALSGGGVRADEVEIQIRLEPPDDDYVYLDIDEFSFIEWRPLGDLPDRFGIYDFLLNLGMADFALPVDGIPLLRL